MKAGNVFRLKFILCVLILNFFITPIFASKQVFVEPDDGYAPVLNQIQSARSSIDMAMYLMLDHRIINALIDAKKRGVKIRIILEKNIYHGKKKPAQLRKKFRKAGILVKWSNPAFFTLTHEKSFAVDHNVVVIMTLNQTYSSYHFNREYGVIDNDKADVSEFENIFQGDWNNQYRKVHQPNLIWSPNNATCKLVALIQSAKKSLFIETEELNDRTIGNLLIQKAQAGVDVRVIMPPKRKTTRQKHIVSGGVHLRILKHKNRQLYMHAKMIIADNQQAYIGSENFSSYSLQMNRELDTLIHNPKNLKRLTKTFNTDWVDAQPVPSPLGGEG